MKTPKKLLLPLLLGLTLLLSGCDTPDDAPLVTLPVAPADSSSSSAVSAPDISEPDRSVPDISAPDMSLPDESDTEHSEYTETSSVPDPEGYYYDLENVVLYLDAYEELPPNYITKSEARDLGWQGGSVERYMDGAAIGGDRFGNREGLLPKASGRTYTECDLNTDGASSRGAERLIFSNDGLYFYTEDHYESFTEVWVEDGAVVSG